MGVVDTPPTYWRVFYKLASSIVDTGNDVLGSYVYMEEVNSQQDVVNQYYDPPHYVHAKPQQISIGSVTQYTIDNNRYPYWNIYVSRGAGVFDTPFTPTTIRFVGRIRGSNEMSTGDINHLYIQMDNSQYVCNDVSYISINTDTLYIGLQFWYKS